MSEQQPQLKPTLHHDIRDIHRLLASINLEKRAAVNKTRLVTAFGIDNAFTTTDICYYTQFRNTIESRLLANHTTGKREETRDFSIEAASNFLNEQQGKDVCIVNLVQIIVLRIVLKIFFEHDIAPRNEDLVFVATKINLLWYDSKSPEQPGLMDSPQSSCQISQDKAVLLSRINDIFQHVPAIDCNDPRTNPLGIILPAYVGLYRSVFNMFLELRFRHAKEESNPWTEIMAAYLADPTHRQWYPCLTNGHHVSTSLLVAEALRLYPPTRRIYVQQASGTVNGIDIETLHRTGEIWGCDPNVFQPARWLRGSLDVRKTEEYMPFGRKQMEKGEVGRVGSCPSRERGGPQLIAILVGVLLDALGEKEGWTLCKDEDMKHDLSHIGALETGKGAYEGLRMRKESL